LESTKPEILDFIHSQVQALHYSWKMLSEGFVVLQLQVANRAHSIGKRPVLHRYEYKRIGD